MQFLPVAALNTLTAPWWKLWLARHFGDPFIGFDSGCRVLGYYWRGKYYVTDCQRDGDDGSSK